MKKAIISSLILSLIPGFCLGVNDRIYKLMQEKQAKMEKLEKCQGTTKNLKIAGISTLGITAVGVGANIAEAVILKDAKSKLADSQNAYNEQDCIKNKGGEWVNGECKDKPVRLEQEADNTQNRERESKDVNTVPVETSEPVEGKTVIKIARHSTLNYNDAIKDIEDWEKKNKVNFDDCTKIIARDKIECVGKDENDQDVGLVFQFGDGGGSIIQGNTGYIYEDVCQDNCSGSTDRCVKQKESGRWDCVEDYLNPDTLAAFKKMCKGLGLTVSGTVCQGDYKIKPGTSYQRLLEIVEETKSDLAKQGFNVVDRYTPNGFRRLSYNSGEYAMYYDFDFNKVECASGLSVDIRNNNCVEGAKPWDGVSYVPSALTVDKAEASLKAASVLHDKFDRYYTCVAPSGNSVLCQDTVSNNYITVNFTEIKRPAESVQEDPNLFEYNTKTSYIVPNKETSVDKENALVPILMKELEEEEAQKKAEQDQAAKDFTDAQTKHQAASAEFEQMKNNANKN